MESYAIWCRNVLSQQVPSANNLCKQFGTRFGPTKRRAWSGSKLFDTLEVFLKDFFEKKWFWKKSADDKQQAKLPSMLRVNQRKQTSLDWLTEHNLTVLVLFYTYTASFIVAADDTLKLSKIRRLTLCMYDIFLNLSCFCCRLLTFFSKLTFSKNSFRNHIRVSNGWIQFWRFWSGFYLFANATSRRQKTPPASNENTKNEANVMAVAKVIWRYKDCLLVSSAVNP